MLSLGCLPIQGKLDQDTAENPESAQTGGVGPR